MSEGTVRVVVGPVLKKEHVSDVPYLSLTKKNSCKPARIYICVVFQFPFNERLLLS